MDWSTFILGFIVGIVILIFVVFVIIISLYETFKSRFFNNFNIQLKEYCDSLPPQPIYQDTVTIPPSNTYNLDVANALMEVNFISSSYNCNTEQIVLPTNFTSYEMFRNNDNTIYGIAYSNDDTLLITFCGSLLLDQWAADLEYPQVKPDKINNTSDDDLVHKGFYNSYVNICQEKILALLSNKNIIITGHSLGGALSTLCALDLFNRYEYASFTHYSFASPRVGNDSFVTSYNNTVNGLRINNTEDLIPQFPIAKMGQWQYEHVGQNIPFTVSLGSIKENHMDAYKQLPSCPLPVGNCT